MADISIDGFCHSATVSSSRNGGRVAEDARTHFEHGIAWAKIGAYGQALEAWNQVVRLAPNRADTYAAIGGVYMTLGCWQEAVRSFQKAIQADPNLIESYYGLGSAYGHLHDYTRSIEAYEQAFRLIPFLSGQNAEAVVAYPECLVKDSHRLEPDTFQDRLQSIPEGFDFTSLMSSPDARRQAARQEQAAGASAASLASTPILDESVFRTEATSHVSRDFSEISGLNPAFGVAVPATDVPEIDEEEWAEPAPARDRGARALLVVLVIVLGCMGGRMAVNTVNESRDRAAYLEATARNEQARRSAPATSASQSASQRGSE